MERFKGTFSHYTLDRFGVFRTPRGEADFCRLPCSIFTDAGKFDCVTKEEVETAILAHCLAADIFDAGALLNGRLKLKPMQSPRKKFKVVGRTRAWMTDGWSTEIEKGGRTAKTCHPICTDPSGSNI